MKALDISPRLVCECGYMLYCEDPPKKGSNIVYWACKNYKCSNNGKLFKQKLDFVDLIEEEIPSEQQ